MNIHRKNPYQLPHEDKQDDIAFYGSVAVLIVSILMIIGGFI